MVTSVNTQPEAAKSEQHQTANDSVAGATAIANSAVAEAKELAAAADKAGLRPHDSGISTTLPKYQVSADTCQTYDAPHLRVLGHWYYDAQQGFILDEVMARIFAIENYHLWHDPQTVMSKISNFDAARFWLNMKLSMMGDIIFERITFTQGPYKGQNFIVQGSILARNEHGHALYATGYISHESSPYSEFIPRELSGDGMFLLNVKSDELICSASFHKMLGYSAEEFPKTSREMNDMLIHPDDVDVILVQNQIITTNLYGDYYECCVRLKHKNGNYIWTIGRALVLSRDENNIATQLIGTETNIHLVQSNFDNMKLMMFNDSLTGLHNRTYFQQNALRYDDQNLRPLSILFVDVTGLKLTNDILGHSYGDYLIIKTCEIIRQALSEELSELIQFTGSVDAALSSDFSVLAENMGLDSRYESKDQENVAYQRKALREHTLENPIADAAASIAAAAAAAAADSAAAATAAAASADATTATPPVATDTPSEATADSSLLDSLTEDTDSADPADSGDIAQSRQTPNSSRAMGFNTQRSIAAKRAIESAYGTTHSGPLPQSKDEATKETHAASKASIGVSALDEASQTHDFDQVHEALISSGLDIIRLAGDEFLVIVPHCPIEEAQSIAQRIKKVRDEHNRFHEQYTSIEERPVPVCFGVGVATSGDALLDAKVTNREDTAKVMQQNTAPDNLKRIIERADRRMQEDKERNRQADYAYLKHYFEQKKGRPVSMRDERRYSYLSEDEREELRTRRKISNLIF